MKPLNLTVSAFGPYANKQEVNFQQLKDKNIFLITGPTGAGKTTIFDAISYALFGEASGSSRSKDSLRSDFASEDTLTYVELEFELRGDKYKVKRIPQQERKKHRGSGNSTQSTEAELTLPNGKIITKVTFVDGEIGKILGINKNQFRQIVMLPQGEFRKLLEADSQERESIFRRIFGTESFQIVQNKLYEQKKHISEKIKERQTKIETHARNIEAGEDELLIKLIQSKDLNISEITSKTRECIETDDRKINDIKSSVDKIEDNQKQIQHKVLESQEINKKIKQKIELEEQHKSYLNNKEEYVAKETKLERGRKTIPLIELQNTYIKSKENLNLKQDEFNGSVKRYNEADAKLTLSTKELEIEENKAVERKNISDSITMLKSQMQKVKEYEIKRNNITNFKKELEEKHELINNLGLKKQHLKSEIVKINIKLKDIQGEAIEKQNLKKVSEEKERTIQEIRDLYKYTKEYISKRDKHKSEGTLFDDIDRRFKEIKLDCENMEDNFIRGQAGLLARDLKEGIECTVCGSTHHPKLAKIIDDVPTEKDMKEAKLKLEELRSEREIRLKNLSDLNGEVNSSKQEILERKNKMVALIGDEVTTLEIQELLPYLSKEGQALSREIESLNKQINKLEDSINRKVELERSLNQCEDNIIDLDKLIEKKQNEYTLEYGVVTKEKDLLLRIENEIPLDVRTVSKLSTKINDLQNLHTTLEKNYKLAETNKNDARADYLSCKASKELQEKNIEDYKKELEDLKVQFENRIVTAGFKDIFDYNEQKMSEVQIKELEADIVEFNEELRSLNDRVHSLSKETQGLSEVKIENLEKDLNQLKGEKVCLEGERTNIISRKINNSKALNEIENINKELKKHEEQYGIVADLSQIANGDNGERITFERYVLAAYFDEIICATNLRLNKMAGGRYILKRKEEKGKGKKQEGLELEVFDNYTGKSRHVKSLSGGESFKASLALALGLADVVQSYAGGISLDTMFVDEGFGTLDPESLDTAIQCLIDLQKSGRLVGIISHVPELKERIDVKLEITPAKEGSKVSFVI